MESELYEHVNMKLYLNVSCCSGIIDQTGNTRFDWMTFVFDLDLCHTQNLIRDTSFINIGFLLSGAMDGRTDRQKDKQT